RETIALNLDGDAALWVDVVHFRRLLHACRQLATAESEDDCRQKLEEAVALYRGDFLAGFTLPDCPEFDEWQRQQTESLRRDLGWALERLGYLHEAAGELRQAIDYAQRWVNLDPLHEAAQRRLMALYARNGQRAAAYRQYQSCQRLLAEELGVEPQIETKQLYEQIQAGKIAPWQPAIRESAALPEWIAPSSEARFVGRQQELARLESYLEQALQGEGRVVFITGGAGRGKSSLLQAFARQAQERHPELVVTGGACSAISGAGDPYAPFRDAMALLCGEF